ncbi:hypothetical protein [Streptomyces sp. NPDC018693]|uniref:hypothetical protein n=1 Tax=unclassified Streptomyces TaxID=2593676 RepID=UPI00378EE6EA
MAGALWLRGLIALMRGVLLVVVALCALGHGNGPTDGNDRLQPAAMATAAAPATIGEPPQIPHEPHGPHGPHGDAECGADNAFRATDQVTEPRTVGTGTAPFAGALGGVGQRLRRPRERRRARTGRTALARTSRWRI